MVHNWLRYVPETRGSGCSPPPGEEDIAVARMHMLARFFPCLPLECTYPLLLGDPGTVAGFDDIILKTREWKDFQISHGVAIAEARKRVCLVTNIQVKFSFLAAVPMAVHPACDAVQALLKVKYFHAAAKVSAHLRAGGAAHLVVAQGAKGAVTNKALETSLCLKCARAAYIDHPAARTTIVLLPRGFSAAVLNFHVNQGEAEDCEWKQWVQACGYAPARPELVPTPESKIAFAAMVSAVRGASTDRARWSAAQMLAPHCLDADIARQMYDIVCAKPSILERIPALHEILQRLANGSTLDKLKVKQGEVTLGAWIYVYIACEESELRHLCVKDYLHPTSLRWRKQAARVATGPRTVALVDAERAFLINQIE